MKTTGEHKMSFNKITLVGNLGRDPELRYTPQGTPVCSFSLATNERRKDRNTGENNDITTWFRVTLWGRQAETASQYLTRGRRPQRVDRKSTRLNSSHTVISYAVFCLKKKKERRKGQDK